LVAHLCVLQVLNALKRHLAHDVVLDTVHERVDLGKQLLFDIWLVAHSRDRIGRGALDSLRAGQEHNDNIVDDVLCIVLVVRILEDQRQNILGILIFVQTSLDDELANKATQSVTVTEVAGVKSENLLLREARHGSKWIHLESVGNVRCDPVEVLA